MVRIVAQGLLFSGFGFASPALGRAVSEEPLRTATTAGVSSRLHGLGLHGRRRFQPPTAVLIRANAANPQAVRLHNDSQFTELEAAWARS